VVDTTTITDFTSNNINTSYIMYGIVVISV